MYWAWKWHTCSLYSLLSIRYGREWQGTPIVCLPICWDQAYMHVTCCVTQSHYCKSISGASSVTSPTWHWYMFRGLWLKSENGVRLAIVLRMLPSFSSKWVVRYTDSIHEQSTYNNKQQHNNNITTNNNTTTKTNIATNNNITTNNITYYTHVYHLMTEQLHTPSCASSGITAMFMYTWIQQKGSAMSKAQIFLCRREKRKKCTTVEY